MKKHLLTIALFCSGFISCMPAFTQVKTADQFTWMTGDWKGSAGQYEFYESWHQKDAHTFTGKSYSLEKNDTAVFEIMRIQQIGEHWTFIAVVGKSNPVLFTLTETKNNTLVFENKEHDYPQRVCYSLKEDGKMLAWIEGEKKGEKSKDEFLLEKIK